MIQALIFQAALLMVFYIAWLVYKKRYEKKVFDEVSIDLGRRFPGIVGSDEWEQVVGVR